jgi:hypothetical protein
MIKVILDRMDASNCQMDENLPVAVFFRKRGWRFLKITTNRNFKSLETNDLHFLQFNMPSGRFKDDVCRANAFNLGLINVLSLADRVML